MCSGKPNALHPVSEIPPISTCEVFGVGLTEDGAFLSFRDDRLSLLLPPSLSLPGDRWRHS